MSEFRYVEQPFLQQLEQLGWRIIRHNVGSVPGNPKISLRSSFREVSLKQTFFDSVRNLNPWLTDAQLEILHAEVTINLEKYGLLEANQRLLALLISCKGVIEQNELTGEKYPEVKLVNFRDAIQNSFVAISQFRVDTPHCVKKFIIPDIVLFVNGLPWVVIECKDAVPQHGDSDPIEEAFEQLMRYSRQRQNSDSEAWGVLEGEPSLFFANQFLIRSCGDRADVGSITSTDDSMFFAWKDIYPLEYKDFTAPLGQVREQETMIQGLLPPSALLDIVRHCIVYQSNSGVIEKVIPRYQQYRAVLKILERLREPNTDLLSRSGVVWHTQGSGKSLTMVFAVRKIRTSPDLRDCKVVMVNDRLQLEDQLEDTLFLTGEKVKVIEHKRDLEEELSTDTSNLVMVMVQKFQQQQKLENKVLERALAVPTFESIGLLNPSNRIIVMIDEAHRTQSSDLGDNLFEALPNAPRIVFTGTPLITERHGEKRTNARFGKTIDTYRMIDSVTDGTTLKIMYEGRTANTAIDSKDRFERRFEDLFKLRSDDEVTAIKRRYGTFGDILEAEARIKLIAEDLLEHYLTGAFKDGFKAQVVANSKLAATRYKTAIDAALKARIEKEKAAGASPERLEQLGFLQTAVVVSVDGTNELSVITAARNHAKAVQAETNFIKPFNYTKNEDGTYAEPNTGIAFLIVCNMLLTGFNAPIEQVMYLDQPMREHTLLQAITRVNRVYKGKLRGYVVDYIGLTNHLKTALELYAGQEETFEDIASAFADVRTEIPILESRYQRLLQFFESLGVKDIQAFAEQTLSSNQRDLEVLEAAITALASVRERAQFDVYLRQFMQSMDVVLPNPAANPFKIPIKRFGYLHKRVADRYQDHSMNLKKAGEKVKQLINQELIARGIDPKIPPLELLSPDFAAALEQYSNARPKASQMEHALRRHIQINMPEDPALYQRLSEKLEEILKRYRDNWEALLQNLTRMRDEAQTGRGAYSVQGLESVHLPFYDLLAVLAFRGEIPEEHEPKVKTLTRGLIELFKQRIGTVNFWNRESEIIRLRGDVSDQLLLSGIPTLIDMMDKLKVDLVNLAKKRQKEILS